MSDTDPLPTVRLSDPGEIAAALPYLMGFPPRESLVAVGLHDGRVGLTARIDLPAAAHRRTVVAGLVRSLLTDRPGAVLLAVVSEDDDAVDLTGAPDLPHRTLVHEAVLAFAAAEVAVPEVLLVRRGRWWSFDCPGSCCAPGAGTPLPAGTSPLAAASVAAGHVLEPDRAALVRRLAPVRFLAAAGMARACEEVGEEFARDTAARGWAAVAEESWSTLLAAVEASAPGTVEALTDRQVARIAWGLRDVEVRDRALSLALGPSAPAAQAVWTELTRRAPTPLDAAPATLVAVSAWVRGEGALASVALERALASEPSYTFAGLLRSALDACLPPAQIRQLIRQADRPTGRRR